MLPMDDPHFEGKVWSILQRFKLDEKKLAVSPLGDAQIMAAQVCEELGLICERKHVEFMEALIRRCKHVETVNKRLRLDHLQDPLLSPAGHYRGMENKSIGELTSERMTNAVSLPSQWKPLKERHRAVTDQTDAKRSWENSLKEKWSRELYVALLAVDAPVLKGMDFCVGADRLHLAIAGKTRATTLRRYVKAWKEWQHWKQLNWGDDSFVHPGMFCEYLFNRYDEPCGPSIPSFICKAVNWFEKLAGFDPGNRVADCRAVLQVRDYMVEQLMKDSPPIRRAPRYPAFCIEAFESIVMDEERTVCARVLAWAKLLKIWGGLRYDDLQKIKPSALTMTAGRLTTILRTTKTSGPGKRVQELPVCISETAYVWDRDWAKVGFDLLKKYAVFDRDYLLPQFTLDWMGFKKKCSSYNDMAAYSCCLRKLLLNPLDHEPMIPEDLGSFWTEHSERATLPTCLAMLGLSTTDRNLVGRWKPDASDNYIRSYNGLISQFQNKLAKTLRKHDRSKILDEVDVQESALAWLKTRRTEISHEECGRIIQRLEGSLRYFEEQGLAEFEEMLDGEDSLDEEDMRDLTAEVPAERVQRECKYVVVHVNNRCKRLHRTVHGCWMARERMFKHADEFNEVPEDSSYTHVCKICWPESKAEDSSSEDTSSSTSSSDSDNSE